MIHCAKCGHRVGVTGPCCGCKRIAARLPSGLNVDAARHNKRLTDTEWYVVQRGAVQLTIEHGDKRLNEPAYAVLWSTQGK